MSVAEVAALREGLRLYHEGDYFEAHEAWEDAWNLADGPRKLFHQGLIQCAVALEHLRRGNPRGGLRVFASAAAKFADLPCPYLGLDHARLLREMAALLAPLHDLPPAALAPGAPHGQTLPIDWSRVPEVALDLPDPAE